VSDLKAALGQRVFIIVVLVDANGVNPQVLINELGCFDLIKRILEILSNVERLSIELDRRQNCMRIGFGAPRIRQGGILGL
jgi:hypothetical protein